MVRVGLLSVSLCLAACASPPRLIEVRIDNQLGGEPATLTAYEIFNGFPLVSMWTTAIWDAPPGHSVRTMEACLPVHFAGVQLTAENADDRDEREALHYAIELRPKPEGGALPEPKQKGIPGVAYFSGPLSEPGKASAITDAAEFAAAVAEAGNRKKLGCWGAGIFEAMERAKR